MWNIIAKLAKLRKSIFSRVTPTNNNEDEDTEDDTEENDPMDTEAEVSD